MTLRISGQAFSDDLFNELAYMDERHEWDAYHERYQLNKGHLGMLAFEDEEFKKQDGTNTEEAIIKTTENIENDYSGVEAFSQFHDVIINLPDDLVDEVEKLAQQYPKYGANGIYTILLWKALDRIHEGEVLL